MSDPKLPPCIVNTCDSYFDLWSPFLSHLQHFWPEQNLEILFNSETKIPASTFYTILPLPSLSFSREMHWGDRLLRALASIDSPFIFMLFDDFFLESHMDSHFLIKCIDLMKLDPKIACIYLTKPDVSTFLSTQYPDFLSIPPDIDYRLNAAPALWRVSCLNQFTHPRDTPWSWEFFGSLRTDFSGYTFLSVISDQYIYSNKTGGAVHRGKWVSSVISYTKELFNHDFDFNYRACEASHEFTLPPTLSKRLLDYYHGLTVSGLHVLRLILRRILFHLKRLLNGH